MGNLLRAVVVSSLAVATPARADSPEIYMQLRGPTTLDVTVLGAPVPPVGTIDLRENHHRDITVRPTSVTPYAQGTERMAIVFVMSGQEVWVGNSNIETDPNIIFPDMLGAIERSVDRLDLAHRLPKGSQAAIVTYARGARVLMPMSPVDKLSGASFGAQLDYYSVIGSDLVSGVQRGLDELERTPADRKLLVVLGDGNDTNGEDALPQLAELKKRAAQDAIHIAAIVYKTSVSSEDTQIRRLVPAARVIASPDVIGNELEAVVHEATQIFYASFDIRDLPVWDGLDHDLTLRLNWRDTDEVEMSFPDRRPHASSGWWKTWWAQLVAGLLGVAVLAGLSRRMGR